MLRYEVLMLTIPEITEDEARSLETQFSNTVKTAKGAMISFERWGKYRLAFPIAKHEYGIYFLARFEIEKEAVKSLEDIKTLLSIKLHDMVVRTMTARLKDTQSLEYQRPPSLEETPKRESYFDRRDDEDRPRESRPSSIAPVRESAPIESVDDDDDDDVVEAEG